MAYKVDNRNRFICHSSCCFSMFFTYFFLSVNSCHAALSDRFLILPIISTVFAVYLYVVELLPFKHFLFLYKSLSDDGKTLPVILCISECSPVACVVLFVY